MPNFVYVTGFEHGESPMSIGGQGLISGSSNAPTLVSGSLARSGDYALFINATGGSKHVMLPSARWTGAAGGNVLVGRFYFKLDSFPTSNRLMFVGGMAGVDCSLWYNSTGDGVLMGFDTPGSRNDYTTVVTGTWYRMDFKIDCSTSFYTVDWQLDGAAKTQNWYSGTAAQQFSSTRIGNSGALTYKMYVDDIAFSLSALDYPIGPGRVIGLRPNSDGTHNAGTNVMEDQTGADINGTSVTAYSLMNVIPWVTGTSTWVKQSANGTSNYVEINFEDMPSGTDIHGVLGVVGYKGASSGANTGAAFVVNTDNIGTEIWGLPSGTQSYNTVNPFYRHNMVTAPAGGWTKAGVDGLKARLGYSSDTTPNPYWLHMMLEVEYGDPYDLRPSGTFVNTYVGTPTLSRLGTIAELDYETGDFSQWTTVTPDGGRYAVTGSAAMAGTTWGASVLHDGSLNSRYSAYYFTQPETNGTIRARFYLNPHTFTTVGRDTEYIFIVRTSDSSWLLSVNLGQDTDRTYFVVTRLFDDTGIYYQSADVPISVGPHWIEVLGKRASGNNISGGYAQLWVDDVSGSAVQGIDNWTRWVDVDKVWFGALSVLNTTSGTFYLDELVVNNTGNYIGPKSSGGTVYSLSGTSITSSTYVGNPYLNQEHALQPSGVYLNTYVGNPYLNQEHALAPSGIYCNTYVGNPYLNQRHDLTASGIYLNTYVGTPYIDQLQGLSASGIYVNTYVGTPYINQVHSLSASGIYVNTYVGNPYFNQEHGLGANGITSSTTVGNPYFNQQHGLSAGGISCGTTVGSPGVGQEHGMSCAGIVSTPTVGTPYLSQNHALSATGITVGSTVGTPYLNQEHGLGATGITSTPTVGGCYINQEHGLGGGGIVVGSTCGSPYINQTHILTSVGITVSTYVGTPDIGGVGTLNPTGITVSTYVGNPYISQEHYLGSGGLGSGATVGTPYIGQQHVLGPGGIVVGGTLGNPGLFTGTALDGSGITVGGTVGGPGISQTHVFGSGGIGSGPIVGQPGPGQEHGFTIGGITISSAVGNPTLVSPPVTGALLMHPIFKKIEQGVDKGMMSL